MARKPYVGQISNPSVFADRSVHLCLHLAFRNLTSTLPVIYHMVYTESWRMNVQTAKVFENGRSQAIRLPKEFRVDSEEVYLKKTPEGFLVIARDPWTIFLEGVEELSDDFMSKGRQQLPLQSRDFKP